MNFNNELLRLTDDSVYKIRKLYNLHEPQMLKEAIDILEEWVKKQTHFLKRDFSREYYERTLITSKGSVEKAKRKIDKICTMRTRLPKFFTAINVSEELCELLKERGNIILPKITEDFYRVILVQASSNDLKPEHFLQYYQYAIITAEYALRYEYVAGFVLILDFRNVELLDSLAKMNLTDFQQFVTINIEGYGARVKKVILLSESKYIEVFIKTVKQFLSEKLSNRIQTVSTLEELHTLLPRKLLPKEYGGAEISAATIKEQWIQAISSEDHIEYMKMINGAGTDESLRLTDKLDEDWVGMPGSFRALAVD